MEESLRPSVKWCARKILLSVVCGMVLVASYSCQRDSEEKKIRAVIEEIRVLSENKEFQSFMKFITSDYSDNFNQKKKDLVPRLIRTFGQYDRLDTRVTISKLEIEGATASAVTRIKVFGFKGQNRERLFGSILLARELHLHFQKRSDDWKVVGSEFIQRQGFY